MAAWIKKPERLVGFATFYPLKDRKLIEFGRRPYDTSAKSSLVQTEQLFKSLGKDTVRVKDAPG